MKLNSIQLPYSFTGFFQGLISHYIENDERLRAYVNSFPTLENFKAQILQKSNDAINRNVLSEVLIEQYEKAGLDSDIQYKNYTYQQLVKLKSKRTYTVTTGHQLCIFTGPLFFIYKLISTINLAEALKQKYPEFDFVPVFWMASEDHDFAEINNINVFGKKIEWENQAGGAVGEISLSSFDVVLNKLNEILGDKPEASELKGIFAEAYTSSNNLSIATRVLIHKLFSKYGLVVLDGNDKNLKKTFSEFIKSDILKNNNCVEVQKTIDNLINDGLISSNKIQVNPRAINCFYLTEGKRERIEKDSETGYFNIVNSDLKFTEASIEKEIENYPERFSPNVVLRPLYQEAILPNLACVLGPNEMAYWFELKSMFSSNNISFPVLVLRNSVMWIDAISNEKIKKIGLDEQQIFKSIEKLENDFVLENSDINFDEEMLKMNEVFQQISSKVQGVDSTLIASSDAEHKKMLNGLNNLEHKLRKAEKQKHETVLKQLALLKGKLFPNNNLQERNDNFIAFYLKYGKSFFDRLKENLNPLDVNFTIIKEE